MKDRGYNRRKQEYMSKELQKSILVLNNYGYSTAINSVWETVNVWSMFHEVELEDIKSLLKEHKIKVYGCYQMKAHDNGSGYPYKFVKVYIGSKEKFGEEGYYKANGIDPN
jgi:hypothetical protein